MALFSCVLLCACAGVLGFNVDIPSRVVYTGNHKSMFGFTVQSHSDGDRKMILVGAPEDEPYHVKNVQRPGAVYRCQPGRRGYPTEDLSSPMQLCSLMEFDKNRHNNVDIARRQIDQKSNQWFGATLTSTGRDGPIVACAPRYVSFVSAKLNQRYPVGSCFVATNSDAVEVNEFSPCRSSTNPNRKTGMCQIGFSAAVSKDGQRLFMGAPGSFFWQGRTFSIDSSARFNYFMPKEDELKVKTLNSKPVLISTSESNPKYDDSYMGSSVTVGDFAGQGIQSVAVGVPRGSQLRGLVVLYTWELQIIKNISGSQIGAYFGYSLASGDIDGDGADDIIIGAPMFTNPKSDGYEHGRIYVIYQGSHRSFRISHTRTGEISKGRFGLAITSLGDINHDGFGDIAVGAPYGGENGKGVVYIYHGGELGIGEKYSQAITAEEISPVLTTFGFSLSGGVDLDNNNYTDLAVGAYKSDSVVFLKSRPVVKVMAEVRFMDESKLISLDERRCTLSNGTAVACQRVRFCLRYDGANVDRQINFTVTLDLDSRQKTIKRLFSMESRETIYTTHILLTQGQQECKEISVFIDVDISDKLTPLEVKMAYELVQPVSASSSLPPVLDRTLSIERTDTLNILNNCGADNLCIPDLRMFVTTPTIDYFLGSGENVLIDVKVENSGEDAFETAYYLQIPPGVTYSKIERLDKDTADASPIYCSVKILDISGNSTLKCDLGNPMAYGQSVNFRIVLEVDSRVTTLNFDMESNSINPEMGTKFDNTKHLVINARVKAVLSIIGISDPPELHYNASLYEAHNPNDVTKLGPQVIHKYRIKNEGPFTVDEAEIFVMWPNQTLTGENLMYMVVKPQWAGDIVCDVARNVNPENLFIQNPYAFMLAKKKEEMMSSELYSGVHVGVGGGYYGQQYSEEKDTNKQQSGQSSGGQLFTGGQSSHVNRNQMLGGQYGSHVSDDDGHVSRRQDSGVHMEAGSQESKYSYSYTRGPDGGVLSAEEQDNHDSAYGQTGTYFAHGESYGGQGVHVQDGQGFQAAKYGGDGHIVNNRTILYDSDHNIISQTEIGTDHGSITQAGEGGSSFSSRTYFDNQVTSNYDSRNNKSFVHGSWSTTETYNSNLKNAGSNTYRNPSIAVVVGEEEKKVEDFGAYAAQNSNNGYKFADVTNPAGGTYNSGSQVYQSGQHRGDYQENASAGAYGTNGGYSYSSSQSGGFNTHTQSGYSFSSSPTQSRESRRRKRQEVDSDLKEILSLCQDKYKCSVVRCRTGRLSRGQEVWLALHSRINASMLNEISQERSLQLSSVGAARVSRLPLVGLPREITWHVAEAVTVAMKPLEAREVKIITRSKKSRVHDDHQGADAHLVQEQQREKRELLARPAAGVAAVGVNDLI